MGIQIRPLAASPEATGAADLIKREKKKNGALEELLSLLHGRFHSEEMIRRHLPFLDANVSPQPLS